MLFGCGVLGCVVGLCVLRVWMLLLQVAASWWFKLFEMFGMGFDIVHVRWLFLFLLA